MDGREFSNMHPLGLPLEPGHISSGAGDGHLIPSTGQFPPFYTAKYFPTYVGLPTQPGFPSLGRGVYHSYIPLRHLEPSKGSSPLLTHMAQQSFIEPQKDGFFFPDQSSAHQLQQSLGKTSIRQTESSYLKENESVCNSYRNSIDASKEKLCRYELSCSPQLLGTSKRYGQISEERLSDVADHVLEIKLEKEKKKCDLPRVPKIGGHAHSLTSDQESNHYFGNNEIKPTHPVKTTWSSICNHSSDSFAEDLCSEEVTSLKDASKHEETIRPLCPSSSNKAKHSDSAVNQATTLNVLCRCSSLHRSNVLCKIDSSSLVPPQPVHSSIRLQSKDNELKTSTCDASDKHHNPKHFGYQICDRNDKDVSKLEDHSEDPYSNLYKEVANNEFKVFRDKESLTCCNSSMKCQGVSDFLMDISGVNYLNKRKLGSANAVHTNYCRKGDLTKEKFRDCDKRKLQPHNIVHSPANLSEQKLQQTEHVNVVSSTKCGSSIPHFQHNHGKEESKKMCAEAQTLSNNKAISEFTYSFSHSESCARESLMKSSGNIEKDKSCKRDRRSPFGGLGHLRLNESQAKASKVQSFSHQDVKKDPNKSEMTKLLTKDTSGFQGEGGEVRNPPIGIAVAVARQKNNGNKSVFFKGHTGEQNSNEQIRHCSERMIGNLEHAALLRENKDLTGISQLNPTGCAALGLSSNLMVTGSPTLLGPWASDSISHLTTHPWLSGGVLPCMWHADNPYSLVHSALHHGINPTVPPGVPASFPPAYTFARDPQNGQFVVIPAEHISNFADVLERRPYLWPYMYSSAHSSLKHPFQLQQFSQQELMQQHELYILLQQQAVNSTDLHRHTQLDITESERNERVGTVEMQRNAQQVQEMQRGARMDVRDLNRRTRHNLQEYHNAEDHIEPPKIEENIMEQTSEINEQRSQCCSLMRHKEVIPQTSSKNSCTRFNLSPIPVNSFLLTNKIKEMEQQEHEVHSSEHHDLCPAPSANGLSTNLEVQEELKRHINRSQDISSSPEDNSHANSLPNPSPSIQHHQSYKTQQEPMDASSSFPVVELFDFRTNPSTILLKSRSHVTDDFEIDDKMDNAEVEGPADICGEMFYNEKRACSELTECLKALAHEIKSPDLEQKKDINLNENADISEIDMDYGKEYCSTQTDICDLSGQNENSKNVIVISQNVLPHEISNEITDHNVKASRECPAGEADLVASRSFGCSSEDASSEVNSVDLKTEDPLAGVNVLIAATEIPQASPLIPVNTLPLDHMLLQGIILLSDVAELELKKRKPINHLQSSHVRPSFGSLLAASTHMLKEVLSVPSLEGLKPESIKLPRELSQMKKYSWKQKTNPHYSVTSDIEVMDSVELDCSVRLAALQRQYKEKQRELAKLQRWRNSESEKGGFLSQSMSFEGNFKGALLNVSEVHRMECGIGDKRGKLHTQKELDSTSNNLYEAQSKLKMKWDSGFQDYLANSPDTALSLPKQINENTTFKFTDHSGRKHEDTRNIKNFSASDSKHLCSNQLSRTIFKEDTDTEEDETYLRNEWSSQSRPLQYSMCRMWTRKFNFERLPSPKWHPCYRTVKDKMSFKSNKPFHLLFLDQETDSFSDSSENSFYQDCSSEEEEYLSYESERLSGAHIEDNGLGLLARFAASVEPSPVLTPPVSNIQLEKQNIEEKKQSLIGTEFENTDSEDEVKIKTKPSVASNPFNSNVVKSIVATISAENKSNVTVSEKGKVTKKAIKLKGINCTKNDGQELRAEVSDDDLWSRRRSERIFLHDSVSCPSMLPDVNTSANSVKKATRYNKVTSSKKRKEQKEKKKRVNKSVSSNICTLRSMPNSLLTVGISQKNRLKVKDKRLKEELRMSCHNSSSHGKCGAVSKLMESMAAEEDFEPSQDSSFSESEHLPMPLHSEQPITPAPRSCIIDKDELKDGLRVLIPLDDKLLYAGHVQTVHSPDIYRVVVEGERGNRPHIYCQEQLLQEAIIDVKPPSVHFLMEGTRIAAYWSQQYRCLYPGTVVCGNSEQEEDTDLVTVEFDDGDTGRIPLSHIRLLPSDYKIQCAEPSPALLVESSKRKGRKTSKEKNDVKEACSMEMTVTQTQRAQKQNIHLLSEEMAIQENIFDESSQTAKKMEENIIYPVNSTLKTDIENSQIPSHVSAEQSIRTYNKKEINSSIYSGSLSKRLGNEDLYFNVTDVELNKDATKGKNKAKRQWQIEEQRSVASFSRGYHKTEAQLLVKLDHEGIMSPKTKKTKEAMIRHESSNSAKMDNKLIAECCSSLRPKKSRQKHLGSKFHKVKQPIPSEDFDHPCNNFKKISGSQNNEIRTESHGSSSDSEDEDPNKRNGKNRQSSGTSRLSSKSSSSTSSSLSSSSSSSATSSSSSNSSLSSSVTDEASSISSEEDIVNASVSSDPSEKQKTDNKSKSSVHIIQQKKDQLMSGRCKPKKREGMHLLTTKELAKRQRLPSVENRPKIAALLQARQLWKWFGKPTQRRGMKGKARKLFYKAIVRGKEIINIGDCAMFLSAGRPNLPYIGCIQSMWESWGNNMVVRVKWFYHPEETCPGKKFNDNKNWKQQTGNYNTSSLQLTIQRKDFMERALYRSCHVDENDVQTVSHKCFVVELAQYEQMIKTKKYHDSEDLYYLAGTYEPITGMIYNTDGVPVIC